MTDEEVYMKNQHSKVIKELLNGQQVEMDLTGMRDSDFPDVVKKD